MIDLLINAVTYRYTVMLAARGDGSKITPYIIFKGKEPKEKLNIPGVHIWYSEKGWINEELSGIVPHNMLIAFSLCSKLGGTQMLEKGTYAMICLEMHQVFLL